MLGRVDNGTKNPHKRNIIIVSTPYKTFEKLVTPDRQTPATCARATGPPTKNK